MKRSAIKRTSSLKRKSPMRHKPRSTKYARRQRDWNYMAWVKRLPCLVGIGPWALDLWLGGEVGSCGGIIEAHHAGVRGVGQKAGDETCVSLCSGHHRALTDRSGPFADWPRGTVKTWELAVIELCRERYAAERGEAEF